MSFDEPPDMPEEQEGYERWEMVQENARLKETLALLHELADDELRILELYGHNPSFHGPNYKIGVRSLELPQDDPDAVTEFEGASLSDCLRKALKVQP